MIYCEYMHNIMFIWEGIILAWHITEFGFNLYLNILSTFTVQYSHSGNIQFIVCHCLLCMRMFFQFEVNVLSYNYRCSDPEMYPLTP